MVVGGRPGSTGTQAGPVPGRRSHARVDVTWNDDGSRSSATAGGAVGGVADARAPLDVERAGELGYVVTTPSTPPCGFGS